MDKDLLNKLIPTLSSDDKEALEMAANFTRKKNRKDFCLDIRTSLESIMSDEFESIRDNYLESSTQAFSEVLDGLDNLGLKINPLAIYHHDQILSNFFDRAYLKMLMESHSEKEPLFLLFSENYEWSMTDPDNSEIGFSNAPGSPGKDWFAEYEVDIVLMSGDHAYPVSSHLVVLSECKLSAEDYDLHPDEDEDD